MINNNQVIFHQISILLWNTNDIIRHKNKLKTIITQKTDIILISKAHLTPSSTFQIPDYETYHCDHPDETAHAGS